MNTLNYLTRHPTPADVPDGQIVVHNVPTALRARRRIGGRGFRIWLAEPSPQWEQCDCPWAPELDTHYRTRRHG
jgi:hypothetical protein